MKLIENFLGVWDAIVALLSLRSPCMRLEILRQRRTRRTIDSAVCRGTRVIARTPKKELQRSIHQPICKLKHSCDKETTLLSICDRFMVYIFRINQSVRHYEATRGLNQLVFTIFESQYPFVTLRLLVTNLWPYCDPLMTNLLTCDTRVMYL